jgi:hypothetical protein
MSLADQTDLFFGRITHNAAQVYVRIGSLEGGGEWSIAGTVRGPIASGIRTLPTTVTLADLGEGQTLLGSCSLPDPNFWTTLMPGTYEISVNLLRDGDVVESFVRSLGIRFFGAAGRDLRWEGKRWVLRGVSSQVSDLDELASLEDNQGVIVVAQPSESLLSRASSTGVLVVAEPANDDLLKELRFLSRWPAVAIAILPSDCDATEELRSATPNILFAERFDPVVSNSSAKWAQLIFCDASDPNITARVRDKSAVPVVAERQLSGEFTLSEARRECDHLQRELAPLGDFAGYVVHVEKGRL